MSLYRTWRPKSFADLVGQDAVVRTLRTALSSGKLAHAYLFSGPRGSGKTSAAKILARCIDCVLGPTPDPDNTCENCTAILAGTALDVNEIDAASNRGIEEIRAVNESAKFAPASMRSKVFIIDEAHMLTPQGANAFLKTLEEPPPHVVFILATTAPEALPATILSRCQRYAFRRIPVGVMIERMREIATAEGIVIDEAALGAIAYRADGGLRDALTMLEQVAAYADGPVSAATVEAAFGATGRTYARGLVEAILAGDGAAALRLIDAASDAGADMLGLVRGAIAEYRHLLVARIDAELLSSDLSQADATAVAALAAATPQPKVVRGLRLLAEAVGTSRLSGNPRLELETAVLRLIVQAEDPSLDALAARVAALEAGSGAPAAAPAAPKPAAAKAAAPKVAVTEAARPAAAPPEAAPSEPAAPKAAASEPVAPKPPAAEKPPAAAKPGEPPTLLQVRSQWEQIKLRATEQNRPLSAPLSRATVDAVSDKAITVGLGDAMQADILRERIALVEAAVADVLGVPLRVVVKAPTAGRANGSDPAPPRASVAASAGPGGGEPDLLTYTRNVFPGSESV